MSKYKLRKGKLITTYGVGSIVPFPGDESLMVAGLDMWEFSTDSEHFEIQDDRLKKILGVKHLYSPPEFLDYLEDREHALLYIPSVRFPRWHYCPNCGQMKKSNYNSFSPETCDAIPWKTGRKCISKKRMIPERFIVACPNGHIDDFPILEWVHRGKPLDPTVEHIIRRSTGGVSSSLSGVTYECSCSAKRSMGGAFYENSLKDVYKCQGSKPWLAIEYDKNSCNCEPKDIKVIQRGGSNVWFANVKSSLYLPIDDNINEEKVLIDEAKSWLETIKGQTENGEIPIQFITGIAKKNNFNINQFIDVIKKLLNSSSYYDTLNENTSEEDYRYDEYKLLIKTVTNAEFKCQNNEIEIYDDIIHKYFSSITLVHKLRETSAFYGFSRLIPSDELSISQSKKMLSKSKLDWLPAITHYGEGIFFELNKEFIDDWKRMSEVNSRIEIMNNSLHRFQINNKLNQSSINPAYVMIHTFAHIMINQLSLSCGYGSSSIRERIYCDKYNDKHDMYGVLLYTASGDSDGSLGGLVNQGNPGKIEDIIVSSIFNAQWCSSDPLCIESKGQGPDSCNLSACYNCALLPETSCEIGNKYLDRATLVGSLYSNLGYFNDLINK